MNTGFHHIGLKYKELERSLKFYTAIGLREVVRWGDVGDEIVMLAMSDGGIIELLPYRDEEFSEKGSLTVAELFISPLGLSFVSKVAPKHLLGLCQGLWLGATALGNLLLWIGPLMYNAWPIWQCWTVFAVVCLISMGVMFGMVKWLEKVTA